jgi:hypothetical protein
MANNFPSFSEITQAFENVRREFGSFKDITSSTVISSFKEIRGAMLTTSLSSFQVFEDMADMINYANEFAKGLGPTFALVTDQIKGSFKEITVFQKGLGVTAEEFKGIVDLSLASGSSIKKIARDIGNFSLQSAKTFNLNSKEISRDITRMIKDVNHFAGLSIKDLNDISIQARKLGVEFEKLTGFSDAIETFEGASEVSARLSQQLGVTIDTMSLIKTENQAEQISLLQEAFKDAGKSSDDMGRRMLRMTAGILNLDVETTKTILSTRGLNQSFQDIQKETDLMNKKQLSTSEILQKLGDNIERVVRQAEPKEGFFSAFVEGIEWGITRSGPFLSLMRNIKTSMMQVGYIGRELGKTLVQIVPGVRDVFTGLADVFRPDKLKSLFKGISDVVKTFFDPTNGNIQYSFIEGFNKIKHVFENFYKKEVPSFNLIGKGFEKFFMMSGTIIGNGIAYVADKLSNLAIIITNFVINPQDAFKKIFANVDNAKSGVENTLSKFIANISKPLSNPELWNKLYDSFSNMFKVVGEKIKPVLTEAFNYLGNIIKESVVGYWNNLDFWNKILLVGILSPSTFGVALGGLASILGLFTGSILKTLSIFKDGFMNVVVKFSDTFVRFFSTTFSGIFNGIGSFISNAINGIKEVFGAIKLTDLGKLAKSAAVGFVSLGATMLLMFTSLKGVEAASGLFDSNKLDLVNKMLSTTANLYITAAGVLGASTLIGALQLFGGPLLWTAQAAGFASLSVTVAGIAGVAIGIIKTIDNMPLSSEIDTKTKVFVNVVTAINGTLNAVTGAMDILKPTFYESIFGGYTKRIDSLNQSFRLILGTKQENTGVYGLITTGLDIIQGMIPEQGNLEKTSAIFSNIVSSMSNMINSISSGVKKLIGDRELPNTSVLQLTIQFLGSVTDMIGNTIDRTIKSISGLSLDKLNSFNKVSDIINVISDVVNKIPNDINAINTDFSSVVNKIGFVFTEDSLKHLETTIGIFQKHEKTILSKTSLDTFSNMSKILGAIKSIAENLKYFPPNTASSQVISVSLPDIQIDSSQIQKISNTFKNINLPDVTGINKKIEAIVDIRKVLDKSMETLQEMFTKKQNNKEFSLVSDEFSILPESTMIPIPDISFDRTKLDNLLKLTDKIDFNKLNSTKMLIDSISGINESANSLGKIMSIEGVEKSFEVISKIVEQADIMNTKLSSMLAAPIELKAKLEELSDKLGMGKKQTYEIINDKIEIKINLEVVMEAGMVEEVIVKRSDSKIRKAFETTSPTSNLSNTLGPAYNGSSKQQVSTPQ